LTTAPREPVLRLAVELPPSVNHSHKNALRRSRRTGRLYTAQVPTGHTRAWRDAAYQAARRAIVTARWRPIAEGKVVVELTYFWPDRRRRDTHNRIKELMDVLQVAGAFANDCQALAREQDFRLDTERPRVEIAVRRKQA
jgi:crossover junction endodeoxyribonuclease RusA